MSVAYAPKGKHPFEVGDKVECVEPWNPLNKFKKGDRFIVDRVGVGYIELIPLSGGRKLVGRKTTFKLAGSSRDKRLLLCSR